MCRSSMMVMAENHSGGAQYTFHPWVIFQRRASAVKLSRSSPLLLLPSAWKLMVSPRRDRALFLNTSGARWLPFKAEARVGRPPPQTPAARGQAPMTCPEYVPGGSVLKDLCECLNCWSHGEKLWPVGWDGGQRRITSLDSFGGRRVYTVNAFLFLQKEKKNRSKKNPVPILSAIIPICVFSNVPLMKERGIT